MKVYALEYVIEPDGELDEEWSSIQAIFTNKDNADACLKIAAATLPDYDEFGRPQYMTVRDYKLDPSIVTMFVGKMNEETGVVEVFTHTLRLGWDVETEAENG